ncbi:MAG: MraY family glycosyltransferase [Candidatus Aminicenantales bacterium]
MKLVGLALMSLALAWIAARLVVRQGLRWGLADVPNERSSHASPVPKGGGFGIPLAAGIAGILFAPDRLWIICPALFVALIAFYNDRKEFSPGIRLLAEAVAAGAVIVPVLIPVGASLSLPLAVVLFLAATLYVVAQANFFNFMDGIDGIAAIEAVISFSLLGAFAGLGGNADIMLIATAVVAGAIGFLPFNFPRAKVFMGDVGSLSLGFLFAVLAVFLSASPGDFMALALFQGVFSIDCAVTIVRRAFRGENLLRAHRRHLYQRLVDQEGWSHPKTSLVYGGVQAAFGAAALLFRASSIVVPALLWSGLFLLYGTGEAWTHRTGECSPK